MARLTDVQRSVLADWWTLAQSAAGGGYTATDTISVAAGIARQYGVSFSFQESSALATLYGYASRMETAAGVFRGADMTDLIEGSMVGVPPWARDQQVMNTAPVWHAVFEFTYIDQNGDMQTDFRTSVFEMTLPDMVGELADDITADAQAMADKYGFQFVDAVPHSLLAV
jgi:hypothetical protein